MKKVISIFAAFAVATVSSISVLADTAPAPVNKPETAQQLRARIAEENDEIVQVRQKLRIQRVVGDLSYVTIPIWIYLALEGLAAKSFAGGLQDSMSAEGRAKAASAAKRMFIVSGTGSAAFVAFKIYNSHEINALDNALIQLQQQKMDQLSALAGLK